MAEVESIPVAAVEAPGVDRIGYRGVEAAPPSFLRGSWAVARWTLRPLFRRWPFWVIVGLGMIGFLSNFALIYIKAEIAVQNPQFAQFLDQFRVSGTGEAYRMFLLFQARAVELMLAYIGVVVLANDFRAGGVAFFLTKSINSTEYIAGRALAMAVVLAFLTLLPGLALFLAYGVFSNSPAYLWENWHLARGIAGYSLTIMIVDGLVVMAVASYFRKTAPLLLTWIAIYGVIPIIANWIENITNRRAWRLLNLWWDIGMMGAASFGSFMDPTNAPYFKWAAAVIVAVCIVSLWTLRRNLRPVEVVH